jgi:hypothetical protein
MSQSTPNKLLLRFFLVSTLIWGNACQKNETASDARSDSDAGAVNKKGSAAGLVNSSSEIQSGVEQSKKSAVLRFPDLGVAGSEMNTAFLARVNHLKAVNAAELNNSNWPYLTAVEVHEELERAKRAKQFVEEERKRKDRAEKFSLPILTIPELLEKKTLPWTDLALVGVVTKVESSLSNKQHGSVTLDEKVKCEFEYSLVNYPGINGIEIMKRGDALFRSWRGSMTGLVTNESEIYHVGQRVQIAGRFIKKGGGAAVFRFEPPSPLGTNIGALPAGFQN